MHLSIRLPTRQATFGGINTNFSIKHDDPTDIAQFGNLEVTGYAATFASSGADQEWLTIQRRLHSTYTGVSTFDGTLKVGNIVSNTGILSVSNAEIDDLYAIVGTIDTLYAQSGIITSLRVSSISGDPKQVLVSQFMQTQVSLHLLQVPLLQLLRVILKSYLQPMLRLVIVSLQMTQELILV